MATTVGEKTPAGPRRRAATELKRTEILKAAVEIFGAKGSTNGTLADIAEQVGMTHAGVLHHFGSKQKLLLEVLAYRDRSDDGLVDQHIPGGPELFLHLVRTAHANALRPGIVQVYAVLSSESVTDEHPARAFFQDRFRVLRSDVRAAFEELCAQEGVTDQTTVDMASASILALMDGLQLQWLLDPTAIDLGEASEFAIRAVVDEVLRPSVPLETFAPPSAGLSRGFGGE